VQCLVSQRSVPNLEHWQSSNNVLKQFKITFNTCKNFTKDSRFSLTASRYTTLKWYRDIYKREKIKTLTELSMVWGLHHWKKSVNPTKQSKRWNSSLSVKQILCKSSCKKLIEDQNQLRSRKRFWTITWKRKTFSLKKRISIYWHCFLKNNNK